MLDLRKLSFSQKSDLKNQITHKVKVAGFKKLATFALSRLMVFFFLSLPVQALFAEDIVNQAANVVNDVPGVAKEINAIITAKHHPYLSQPDFLNRTDDLATLYKLMDYQLLWLGNAETGKNILEVLNLLDSASANGLNPANYDTQMLRQKLPTALNIAYDNYKQLALYDTAISLSLVRFLHDLHYGRVNPQGINYKLKLREKKLIDLPALIKDSLALGAIKRLSLTVEPKLQQYQKLKAALATYRLLARKLPPFQLCIEKSIRPGDNLPQIEDLQRFLAAVGDMPEESDTGTRKSMRYTGKIVAGVKKFQQRHGLNSDGVIGKETLAAINVPLTQRVTQIELALERLRWLPELNAGPYIIVNIPAFQLWAFDDIDQFNSDVANMRVVVGKAMKNETPVLMAEMRFIDFMPYWNVPYNIVKKEILPKLMQNPGYLDKENMELVATYGNETSTRTVAFTGSSIAGLKQGTLRIRQRPGKKNALGRVKFIFPNKEDVYLHDTPSQTLFGKSRRDFSHGCVRVANPEGLAEFALKNQWSKEAIQQALNTPKTRRVILKKSIPVLFFYTTSFFDHNNNLAFYPDIYGYDTILLGALRKPEDLSDQSLFVSAKVAPAVLIIK